ncbi:MULTISPECIES: flagellar hook-length control protein FliK [unclassified Romboutsia]|uniref:flagellar hook-length control protein FliK n=1 Tax=unclassified Romboutsia TaxID=2626894 RepID=UPI0018975DDF|nr:MULTISPECIES: flagellar hook-length control protein FliK [unclassified Romboutsia]MDB8803901.1 flagellar hook-length control protein FliK [Romboutsia sp. 1001216sp1]MDB8806749.1 flagellar hook-length control protein FliK [Romboutsia sp. 1001216sp1]MDB8809548.1 flagellar hook-length control protein FliK [Romboutsia sp. 1001216sp1]MDB8815297.1 flagellar hook-length control protein FliK [Romboutsia sp. 1001216sp1]MDB8817990.1 flagellar hook-length control protein FliK [Romboutsia sp. 1001216sp
MNLNMSIKAMTNAKENILKKTEGSKDIVNCFFGEIESKLEDMSLNFNTDESNKKDIDFNLLQNIIFNLKYIYNFVNDELKEGKDVEGLNESINNIQVIFDSMNIDKNNLEININNKEGLETLENTLGEIEFKSNLLSNNDKDKLNDLLEKINNDTENIIKKFDINENKSSNNIKSKPTSNSNELLNNDFEDTKNYKKNDLIKETKYRELEINSLINKKNLNKSSSLDNNDLQISKLEDILNKGSIGNLNTNNILKNENTYNLNDSSVKEIRKIFINEDIIKTVNYLKRSGNEEIKIKVNPIELGEMTIKLVKHGEENSLSITVSKNNIFDLVNKNINDITKHLNDMNIKVKDVSININSENQNVFSDNLNQNFNNKNSQQERQKNNQRRIRDIMLEDINEISNIEEDNLNILV